MTIVEEEVPDVPEEEEIEEDVDLLQSDEELISADYGESLVVRKSLQTSISMEEN